MRTPDVAVVMVVGVGEEPLHMMTKLVAGG